jgi:hypothetical protein
LGSLPDTLTVSKKLTRRIQREYAAKLGGRVPAWRRNECYAEWLVVRRAEIVEAKTFRQSLTPANTFHARALGIRLKEIGRDALGTRFLSVPGGVLNVLVSGIQASRFCFCLC